MGRINKDIERKLRKAKIHNDCMKRYYANHPEQAERNRQRSREYQRRKREAEKAQKEAGV